jgi:hypothetical protein
MQHSINKKSPVVGVVLGDLLRRCRLWVDELNEDSLALIDLAAKSLPVVLDVGAD